MPRRLLELPAAWEALKASLKTGTVAIDTLREFLGDSDTGTMILPDPIRLNVKVVLFGDWFLHYALTTAGSGFRQAVPRAGRLCRIDAAQSQGAERNFAYLWAAFSAAMSCARLTAAAMARMVEESSRQAEDAERLSLRLDPLIEMMTEADYLGRPGWPRCRARRRISIKRSMRASGGSISTVSFLPK